MNIILNDKIIEENSLPELTLFSENYINGYGWYFNNKLLFWEDIYFQLMGSMRKMRIQIPLSFTPEMFEQQVLKLIDNLTIKQGRYKISVFRNQSFIIKFLPYKNFYKDNDNEIDIYKEINVYPNLLSSIYVYSPLNDVAEKYATENDLQELLLLNNEKRIARTIQGNLFIIKKDVIYTPPTSEGAYISVLKQNFINFLHEKTEYKCIEEKLSPFDTQSADEVFILSDKEGIMPIKKIKKKTFESAFIQSYTKKFIGNSL